MAVSMWDRAGAIARKEFLQIARDHALMRLIILMPIGLLILFGYALNSSVKQIPMAVVDGSHDRISQALSAAFEHEDRFRLRSYPTRDQAMAAVRAGRERATLEIPAGALEAARSNEAVPLTVYVDGSDPTMAAQIRAGSAGAIQEVLEQLMAGKALADPTLAAPLSPTFETLYNPDNLTPVYMVPGLIGLILTQITILLTAIAIVKEREAGTMEALIATPARPLEVVLGKIAPYLGLGLIDAGIILAVGIGLFKVPFVGNPGLLALALVLFVLGSLGIGVAISTIARTQIQAMFGTIAYLFPSIFLSGLLFPLEGLNPFFTALSYLIPLRYFLQVVRGVMLRGAGLESLGGPIALLALFAVLSLSVASLRFRKTL